MPRLWEDTIDAHRRSVDEAILSATVELVAEHGLASVTMSQIAARVGIGRATLYKYYPDVESILVAWHERQIGAHLAQLAEVGQQPGPPLRRLRAVLTAYATISRQRHGDQQLASLLHSAEHVRRAQAHLRDFVAGLITEAATAGEIRTDIPPAELAAYCLHALTAAGVLPSAAAVGRLVDVTLTGLQPPQQ
ncbi:MAG: TetR/AcrR family transcriptional regulator [Micromonosporaceae bacterium]|nr:TetR/AcrR family transcriptional regulator [Micromonosporaceae bacterium]